MTSKKCEYYIIYPKDHNDDVKIVCLKKKPVAKDYPNSGFAEGGYLTKEKATNRLNWMDIPVNKRKFE